MIRAMNYAKLPENSKLGRKVTLSELSELSLIQNHRENGPAKNAIFLELCHCFSDYIATNNVRR